jgi:hypothetical protein
MGIGRVPLNPEEIEDPDEYLFSFARLQLLYLMTLANSLLYL